MANLRHASLGSQAQEDHEHDRVWIAKLAPPRGKPKPEDQGNGQVALKKHRIRMELNEGHPGSPGETIKSEESTDVESETRTHCVY